MANLTVSHHQYLFTPCWFAEAQVISHDHVPRFSTTPNNGLFKMANQSPLALEALSHGSY